MDIYDNADEVLKDYPLIDEVNNTRRAALEELNDGTVFQRFCSQIRF